MELKQGSMEGNGIRENRTEGSGIMQAGEDKIRFRLNMQIIADGFQETFPEQQLHRGRDAAVLESVCFLTAGMTLQESCVYIVRDPAEIPAGRRLPGAFLLPGEMPAGRFRPEDSILQLPRDADLFQVMNLCQEIFHRNREWEEQMHEIMLRDGNVDDLCRVSYYYFQNPLFVHDTQLNAISCPVWKEGMINWKEDEKTGLRIAPFDVVYEFKTDPEYRHTLTTHGAGLFSADLRGHRDIYVNIWNTSGGYEGRLVICEMEHALKPGQFPAAEFLAEMVRILLSRSNSRSHTYGNAMDQMFLELIRGSRAAEADLAARIAARGWHVEDSYLCVRINMDERDMGLTSGGNFCTYMDAHISDSKSFFDEEKVCIIVNVTRNRNYSQDIAYVLREGLYKAGLSEIFHNLADLQVYYRQASIALKYCLLKNDTNWSRTFGSIALDYLADHCSPEFDSRFFCDASLIQLAELDQEHGTDLYKTLKVYLLNERNTVKTSEELYIGRSTLFYRLKKIRELTGLDTTQLAKPERNLYLRLSLFILQRKYGW